MPLELHPSVKRHDLPKIYRYIALKNVAAAERVFDAIEASFDLLSQNPEAGTAYEVGASAAQLRMLPVSQFSNYLVLYRLITGGARVLYVCHGARDLQKLIMRARRT